jgi:hypothetical protein
MCLSVATASAIENLTSASASDRAGDGANVTAAADDMLARWQNLTIAPSAGEEGPAVPLDLVIPDWAVREVRAFAAQAVSDWAAGRTGPLFRPSRTARCRSIRTTRCSAGCAATAWSTGPIRRRLLNPRTSDSHSAPAVSPSPQFTHQHDSVHRSVSTGGAAALPPEFVHGASADLCRSRRVHRGDYVGGRDGGP